jgi:hypothetical protein
MGVGCQCRSPTTLPRKDTWFPAYRRLGGQAQTISPPVGFNPWTIQPITSCYTLNTKITYFFVYKATADPGGCAAYGSGLQALDCCECMFVCFLCLLCVVWVAACVMSWLLIQRSPTECVCVCYPETWTIRWYRPKLGCCTHARTHARARAHAHTNTQK